MQVLASVSFKGGSGKSTIVLALASAFADAGARVLVIDADPNAPLMRWSHMAGRPDTIRVLPALDSAQLEKAAQGGRAYFDVVIIDSEGSRRSLGMQSAVLADAVLVPCRLSVLDAIEAIGVDILLRSTTGRSTIPLAYVPSATTMLSWRERTARDALEQLQQMQRPVLPGLPDRAAHRAVWSYGGTVHSLDDAAVSGLPSARADAEALAAAVMTKLLDRGSHMEMRHG
ncbi:ParA family protein [Aurantimonas sp. 22II-16-19i]|uniref:ParA family protein n=1 Tax=Aurantimonas sp. 22II-16-19i TaxID=1317114 RepID=UPI0009F7E486|nr:ParA family protein [Aurantimonas sp. 22II-16-19i]ORE93254.1 ParA-like protein [Aurantimonas sp. 22II-16-19i]